MLKMKFFALASIFAIIISTSNAGFLKNLITGRRQELVTSSTTERGSFRPMTQGAQFYLEDNNSNEHADTYTIKPQIYKAQQPSVTTEKYVAAFSPIHEAPNGRFTFTCPPNDTISSTNCLMIRANESGLNNGYQMKCNSRVCTETGGKGGNYECPLSQEFDLKVYVNLQTKRATCEQMLRTIFNPQSRNPCGKGQRQGPTGGCRDSW